MKDAEPVQVLIRNTIDEMEQEATFRFKNERESLKTAIQRRKAFLENHDVDHLLPFFRRLEDSNGGEQA